MNKAIVFGGAGFIGSNLSKNLLESGYKVTVFDSLARRGSERNLQWLKQMNTGQKMTFIHGDIRDFAAVQGAVEGADEVFHLAAQVAVTTSVDQPRTDFEVNALGTLNVLEAIRLSARKTPLVFTSTNKVYGGLEDVGILESESRYGFREIPFGVPESQPLDFHSPYGCSKGAADQYVRDYSRIYDIPAVVFRMSCIYGPRQFGTEDQGWIAHLMIAAATGKPIRIYGNGKQVRDVLFVEDLVRALRTAVERIDVTAGQVYNIGGGPENALAVWSEFGDLLAKLKGARIPVKFTDWRPGDQPCYISDVRKAGVEMGWQPRIDKRAGITKLWEWVNSNIALFETAPEAKNVEAGVVGVAAA